MEEEQKNNHIIVVQNSNSQKKGPHMSMANWGRGVAHFKYWILGCTLAFGILGYVGARFVINPSREKMTTNIELQLALTNDSMTYLDGTAYTYSDIVSKQNIDQVLSLKDDAGNLRFPNYSYESLMNDNAVSISPKQVTTTDGTQDSLTQFTIVSQPNAFRSEEACRNFLRALIQVEIDRADNALDSFSLISYLPATQDSFAKMEFATMLDNLTKQYTYLNSTYQDMVKTFGSSFSVNSKKLNDYYRDFSSNFSSTMFSELSGRLLKNKLVNISKAEDAKEKKEQYENLKSDYVNRFPILSSQLSNDKEQLSQLTSIRNPSEEITSLILKFSEEITSLEAQKQSMISELRDIGYTVTEKEDGSLVVDDTNISEDSYLYKLDNLTEEWLNQCKDFSNELKETYTSIDQSTKETGSLYRSAYKLGNKNTVIVMESNYGTISGHISHWGVAFSGALIGFILFSFIFAEIDLNRNYRKEQEAVNKPAEKKEEK